jgi:hypothetical protein
LAFLDVTAAGPWVEVLGQESTRLGAVAVIEQYCDPSRYSSFAMLETVLSDRLPGSWGVPSLPVW